MRIPSVCKVAIVLFTGTAFTQEPCAELRRALDSYVAPADLALRCLRSVPLQRESDLAQLRGLQLLTGFQSDLAYLNNSEPTRLYPDVDLIGGLNTLQQRVQDEYYSNEYDFQLDIYRLYSAAYDGHLAYIPDIVDAFAFIQWTASGDRFPLLSVSTDGSELPEVYAFDDAYVLADINGRAAYTPSAISQIDGQDIEEYLNHHAAITGSYHDPDANYNLLFPNGLEPNGGTTFEEFRIYPGKDQISVTFSNGTETTLEIVAVTDLDLSGVTDAESFYQECCTGFVSNLVGSSLSLQSAAAKAEIVGKSPELSSDIMITNVERARPRLRKPSHHKRQDAITPQLNGTVAGFFPSSPSDLAVLTIPTFEVGEDDISLFQSTIADFLETASQRERTRLIIDLRGNPGGLGYLAHDTFRQIFPGAYPYDAANFRAVPLLDFTGRVISRNYADYTSADFDNPLEAPSFFSGAYPFNFRQQLDATNSTFDSWSEFFGPADIPSLDELTSLVRPNLTNVLQTFLPVYPVGRSTSERARPQVFDAENIILLQDGGCASACALFTEFMKSNAPGDEQVRQVVVGGRPREGPSQGVGGVKGGQLGLLFAIGVGVLSATDIATAADVAPFRNVITDDVIGDALIALDRAAVVSTSASELTGGSPAASVNFRNSIRQGDETITPLQHVYDAADCRIFYTAAMHLDSSVLWQRVYEIGWEEGSCVEGSTGHPSASFGTDYGNIDIPEGSRSDLGINISGTSGGDGEQMDESSSNNQDNNNDDDANNNNNDEQGAATMPQAPLRAITLLLALALSFSVFT